MNPTAAYGALSLAILLFTSSAAAQGHDRVLGNWIGIGEENEGQKVTVERDTLVLDGERVPLRFGAAGVMLVGPPDEQERLTYEFRGEELIVRDSDSTTRWRRDGAAPKPAALQPVATKPFVSKAANIAGDLPDGWTVMDESGEGCTVNPGFAQGQSLDMLLSLHCLPLDAKYHGVAIDQVLAAELPDARRSLADGGIRVRDPAQPPQAATVGGKQAAVVTLRAETDSQRRGIVWLALRVDDDRCLVCNAIFLDGQEAAFLPRVEGVFASLRPASGATATPEPSPAPTPTPTPTPSRERTTLVLEKRELVDAESNGMVSHTILVPKGWDFEGGVRWTRHPTSYVHFVGRMRTPDGAELSFDYNRPFAYTTDQQALANKGQRMGGTDENGNTLLGRPTAPGEAALRGLLPLLRPAATNVRLVEAKGLPEAERRLREALAPTFQQFEQSRQPGSGVEGYPWAHVEQARIAYDEGGQQWEEMCIYSITGVHLEYRSLIGNFDSGIWELSGVRTVRAPRGQLDAALPTMVAVAGSLQETPRWSMALHNLRMRIAQIQHDGNMRILREMGRRSEIMARANSELSDQQMASWRERQSSIDGTHRATVNSIIGVHDYRTPDGGSLALDNGYERVFQDRLGNVVLTNDPSYDPNAGTDSSGVWSQLQRIQHTGR